MPYRPSWAFSPGLPGLKKHGIIGVYKKVKKSIDNIKDIYHYQRHSDYIRITVLVVIEEEVLKGVSLWSSG